MSCQVYAMDKSDVSVFEFSSIPHPAHAQWPNQEAKCGKILEKTNQSNQTSVSNIRQHVAYNKNIVSYFYFFIIQGKQTELQSLSPKTCLMGVRIHTTWISADNNNYVLKISNISHNFNIW